jgi:hypothetical protein
MPWSQPGTGWRPRDSDSVADGKGILRSKENYLCGRRKMPHLKQQSVSNIASMLIRQILIKYPYSKASLAARLASALIPLSPLDMARRFPVL